MDRVRKESMSKKLTWRHIRIIKMLADGMIDRESAQELGVTECSIKHHISSALYKTGTRNRPSLVAYAFRNGLIK